jgi:hypothetical protein
MPQSTSRALSKICMEANYQLVILRQQKNELAGKFLELYFRLFSSDNGENYIGRINTYTQSLSISHNSATNNGGGRAMFFN